MPVSQLKQTEMAADGIQRFVRFNGQWSAGHRPGAWGVALEFTL